MSCQCFFGWCVDIHGFFKQLLLHLQITPVTSPPISPAGAVRYVDGIFPSLWLDDMASFTAQRDFHGLWVLKGMVCVGSKMLVFWFKKTVGDTFVLFEKDVRCLWQFCKDLLFSNTWLLWNSVDKRMDKDVQTLDLSTWRTWQKENWVLKLEKVVALDALFGNLG